MKFNKTAFSQITGEKCRRSYKYALNGTIIQNPQMPGSAYPEFDTADAEFSFIMYPETHKGRNP